MDARKYPITLDLGVPNCKLPFDLYQGSQDLELEVTLTNGGNLITVSDSAVVTVNAVYECTKGGFVLEAGDTGYNVTVANNKINIPFVEGYVAASGLSKLVLKIVDGITAYTFSMEYKVIENPAYVMSSTPDNLPTYNQVKQELDQAKANINTNSNDINTNKQAIADQGTIIGQQAIQIEARAKKDLSNVQGIADATDGSMFYKDGDEFKEAPLNVDKSSKKIVSDYSIEVPGSTIYIGPNVSISENGGFLENHVLASGKYYLMLDYENNKDTGTDKPIYWARGPINENTGKYIVMQPVEYKVMRDVKTVAYGYERIDMQVQRKYLNFLDPVNNFRMKVNVNGKDVAYFPSEAAFKGREPGINFSAGIHPIEIQPFFSSLTTYNITFTYVADGPINLLGDGSIPWIAVDRNLITKKYVLVEGDSTSGDTAEQMVAKLESLSGDKRLDAVAIKNLPSGESDTAEEIRDKLISLQGDERLSIENLKDIDGTISGNYIESMLNSYGIEIKKTGDGSEFLSSDGTYKTAGGTIPFDNTDLSFKKSFGVEFLNVGATIPANSFVLLYGAVDRTFKGDILTRTMGYKGNLIAYVRNKVDQNAKGYAELETIIKTDKTGVVLGQESYIGFKNLTGDVISIGDKNDLNVVLGACGVFGDKDTSNNYVSTFSSFKVIASNILDDFNINSVSDADFKAKSIKSGMLEQGLEDVSLDKLKEKGVAAELADNKLANVPAADFDAKFRQTQTLRIIYNRLPLFRGLRAKVIESQQALTPDQFSVSDQIIHIRYQVTTQNQFIEQVLPAASINKVLIIEVLYSGNITAGGVKITPAIGEFFNGATTSYTINKEGMAGNAFSEIGGWDWIPYSSMPEGGVNVNDQKSNFFLGMESIGFGNGFTATQDPNDKSKVKIDYASVADLSFEDMQGDVFEPSIVKSELHDIEIHKVDNPDGTFTANLSIAPYVTAERHNEGILAFLGISELVNSKYPKSKLNFGDVRIKGGSYVYQDLTDKSFILQDTDPQDDPNISGGTTFILAGYIEPNQEEENKFTQDGYVEIDFVDSNEDILIDINGEPLGVRIEYKAGDALRKELLIGEYQAKGQVKAHLRVRPVFANEEIIALSANSCVMVQSTKKDESAGLALIAFMAFTGYGIKYYIKYYGFNSLNLSQFLIFNEPESELSDTTLDFGDNTFLDVRTKAKVSINDYRLIVSDNGVDLPVWSLFRIYDQLDAYYLKNKNYKVIVTIVDKDNAYKVSLLKYTGNQDIIPKPNLLSYNNDVPVFEAGWSISESMFISEDVVSGDHSQSYDFTVPSDAKKFAIIFYPNSSQLPSTVKLKKFEGDITPWFNKVMITSSAHISEVHLSTDERKYVFDSIIQKGIASLRYTVNSADTKMPWGAIHSDINGAGKVVNDRSWNTPGSSSIFEGDGWFKEDGKVTLTYTAMIYNETNSDNLVNLKLVKMSDGSTVPGSEYTTTLAKNSSKATKVTKTVSFNVKQDEKYRIVAKSNIDDGFYLQCNDAHIPLLKLDITFEAVTALEKSVEDLKSYADEITFVESGKPVADPSKYKMEIDVKTGQTEIKEV